MEACLSKEIQEEKNALEIVQLKEGSQIQAHDS